MRNELTCSTKILDITENCDDWEVYSTITKCNYFSTERFETVLKKANVDQTNEFPVKRVCINQCELRRCIMRL